MAILHRQDIALTVAADGDVQPLIGGYVTVYDVGAVASGTSNDTTIPVYTGHGVAINDCIMVGITESTFRLVTGSSATQITVNASVSVVDGDVIVNLGTDSAGGSGTPNYDGSTIEIYSVPDNSNPIADSTVTIDGQGNFSYYFNSEDSSMELVRDSDGTPVSTLIRDAAILLSTSGTDVQDNEIARFDGTTGRLIQAEYTSNGPTISDAGAINAPGSHVLGAVTVSGNALVSGTLEVTGITTFGDKLEPDADAAVDIGVTNTGRFRNLYLSGVASIGGAITALSTLTVTGLTTLARTVCAGHFESTGTAPSGVSNIGSGWGTTSSAAVTSGGTDNRFNFTITTSGATFANPATVVIPFNSTFANTPFAVVAMNSSGTGTTANISWTVSTTGLTVIYKAVPVTGNTYIFSAIVIG